MWQCKLNKATSASESIIGVFRVMEGLAHAANPVIMCFEFCNPPSCRMSGWTGAGAREEASEAGRSGAVFVERSIWTPCSERRLDEEPLPEILLEEQRQSLLHSRPRWCGSTGELFARNPKKPWTNACS